MTTFKPTLAYHGFNFGMLPTFFWEHDKRPASEQLADRYSFGGGYSPLDGWKMLRAETEGEFLLVYPEDSPLNQIGRAQLNDETLIFFEHSWLAIIQPNGDFVVTRVD